MTVKELALFTGKNKSTIGRWVEKCKSDQIKIKLQNATQYNPADFSIEEIEHILLSGSMSKDAISILMENARKNNQPNVDYELIGKMIGAAVKAAIEPLFDRIEKKELKQIEAPIKPDRDALRQIVNQYADKKLNGDFRQAWHDLYSEIYYRLHINVSVRAKNEGIKIIDYIDRENLISSCVGIMRELLRA